MRKALVSAIYLSAASLALASDLGGDGLGGPTLQPRANSAQLGEPGLSNRETAQVDPVLIEAGEPALDFRFAENKWMRDSVSNKQSLITFSRSAAQSPGTYVGADGLIHDAAVNLALYSEQFDQYISVGGTRMLANQIDAPDEKQTADFLQETGAAGFHYLSKFGGTVQSSKTYTFSVFVKYNGTKYLKIYLDGSGAGGNVFGTGAAIVSTVFDVQNGIVFSSSNTVSTGISDAGNGWYRISITANSTGSGDAQNQYSLLDDDGTTESYTGDGTSGIYFWGAQLQETDAATMAPTAYIHTTSQALAAPRFDHEPATGNLTTNLVKYSEFQSGWTSTNITKTLQAATDPFGGTSATKLEATAGTAQFYQAYPAGVVGQKYRWSAYVKALNSDFLRMGVYDSSFGWSNLTDINVADGTSPDGATITDVGNGWYRVEVLTAALVAAGAVPYFFVTSDISGSAATGGESVLVFGAQFEQTEASAGPYVRTLGETRSISDANAESLGLLVEEQRANAFTESEFRNGYLADSSKRNGLLSNVSFSGLSQNTGVSFGHDGATVSYVYKLGVATSSTVTFSVFVKMDDGAPPSFGSSSATNSSNDFVIVLGAVVASPLTYSVEDYGNGMYRVSVTATSGAVAENTGVLKYGSNSSRTFKVSGYQVENGASFPTSYIPTTGSAQTRYADIAAVQDEDFSTTNLLAYSESFDVGWTASAVTVTQNATVSPDGQTTADLLVENSATAPHYAASVSATTVSGQTYTATGYVKAAGRSALRVSRAGGGTGAGFDLSAETSISASGVSSSIEDVGDGWYRVKMTFPAVASSTSIYFEIQTSASASSQSYAGDGTSGLYLWGASLTATEYPVEYTTTRNLLTDSQDFERSTWNKRASSPTTVLSYDVTQAPDGTNSATELSQQYIYRQESVLSGASYVTSMYIKNNGAASVRLYSQIEGGGSYRNALIDTSNFTVISSTFSNAPLIVDVGNGWHRVSIVELSPSSGTRNLQYWELTAGAGSVYLWGAQLEPGTTATDYVRTVDVVGKAYGFYEPTEGTVFVEAQAAKQDFGGQLWFNRDQTSNRGWSVVSSSTTAQNVYYRADDNSLKNLSLGSVTENSVNKMVSAIDADDVLGAINGGTVQSAALTAYYVFNQLRIGHQYTAGDNKTLNGHIKRLTYWPVRQSDSTLQVITE